MCFINMRAGRWDGGGTADAHANRKGVGEAVGDRVRESQTLPVFIVTQLTLHVQLRARGSSISQLALPTNATAGVDRRFS